MSFSNDSNDIRIRSATPDDVPLILQLIRELAEYEKLAHEVVATEARLRETLFGNHPAAEVVIAECGDGVAGQALFFHNYSTFHARRGLYLEDLFVRPAFRGRGIGRALLTHLAQLAVDRDCARFEWAVLDWNLPSIGFYRALGAKPQEDWTVFRVDGDALLKLAGRSAA